MSEQQHLLYLQQFQTIICRQCQYGITKDGVRLHFERHHQAIALKRRRELENYAKEFDVCEAKDVNSPSKEIKAIEGLKIHEGFVCRFNGCNHSCVKLKSIQKHCQIKHDWTASKGTRHI
jgi:hypothetical protein